MADDKILVEVLTLDSLQWPACGYMVDVLNTLPQDVKDIIEYKEWSIKNAEGINMFVTRKGRVLPTLCINEACVYESIIPTLDELYETLIGAAKSDEQKAILEAAYKKYEEEYWYSGSRR